MTTPVRDDLWMDYDFISSHCYPGAFVCRRTARKEHKCVNHRNCKIRPGQEYVEITYSPWLMTSDDPDVPTAPLGAFERSRFHRYTDEHNTDGKES